MAVEGVMVSYNYSDEGEHASILTVSASGIRFNERWVLTHGSILSPLKEAKIIQNSKGKPILNDEFYANLPEIHVTCEKKRSKRPTVYESVEGLSRERGFGEMEHSSYQIRVLTGRVCHVWQCPLLDRCVDDILYGWTIGHRDGDVERQTQLGKALLSVFVLVDLQADDRGDNLKKKWRNIRDCFKKAHKARLLGHNSKNTKYCFYNLLTFLTENDLVFSNTPGVTKSIEIQKEDGQSLVCQNVQCQNIECQSTECQNAECQSKECQNAECQSTECQSAECQNAECQNVNNCQENCVRNESDDGASSEDSTPSQEDADNGPLVWPAKRLKPIKNEHFDAENWLSLNSTLDNEEKKEARHKKSIYEEDEDRLFFMSLVKEFKKIPGHAQIQVKLDLLKVLQKAQCQCNSNGTTTLEEVIRLNDIRD